MRNRIMKLAATLVAAGGLYFAAGMSSAWAQCTAATIGPGANCAGANLTNAFLAFRNLAGVNLAGANLTGANFTGADLTGATLSIYTSATVPAQPNYNVNTNATNANFYGANLSAANLIAVNFTGANLSTAILNSANISYGLMSLSNMYQAQSNAFTNITNIVLNSATWVDGTFCAAGSIGFCQTQNNWMSMRDELPETMGKTVTGTIGGLGLNLRIIGGQLRLSVSDGNGNAIAKAAGIKAGPVAQMVLSGVDEPRYLGTITVSFDAADTATLAFPGSPPVQLKP